MFLYPRSADRKTDQMVFAEEFLGQHRILSLGGPIVGVHGRVDIISPVAVANGLLAFDRLSYEPIKLIIDSCGGIISDALVVYDTMKTVKSPVWTIGRNCASAAVLLLVGGEFGHRYLYSHSRVMLHQPRQDMGTVDPGTSKGRTKELLKAQTMIAEVLRENGVDKTVKQIIKDMDREFWLSADEAIEYGLADRIVDVETLA